MNAWRQAWKQEYKQLTLDIRRAKADYREAQRQLTFKDHGKIGGRYGYRYVETIFPDGYHEKESALKALREKARQLNADLLRHKKSYTLAHQGECHELS